MADPSLKNDRRPPSQEVNVMKEHTNPEPHDTGPTEHPTVPLGAVKVSEEEISSTTATDRVENVK